MLRERGACDWQAAKIRLTSPCRGRLHRGNVFLRQILWLGTRMVLSVLCIGFGTPESGSLEILHPHP